jgi:hypothetical protein
MENKEQTIFYLDSVNLTYEQKEESDFREANPYVTIHHDPRPPYGYSAHFYPTELERAQAAAHWKKTEFMALEEYDDSKYANKNNHLTTSIKNKQPHQLLLPKAAKEVDKTKPKPDKVQLVINGDHHRRPQSKVEKRIRRGLPPYKDKSEGNSIINSLFPKK